MMIAAVLSAAVLYAAEAIVPSTQSTCMALRNSSPLFLARSFNDRTLPPGDLGLPLLNDKTFGFTKRGSQFLEERHEKLGQIFKCRLFFGKAIVVTGAENLKTLWLGEHDIVEAEVPAPFAPLLGEKGVFMSKGENHKKLKQQLARAFSPDAVKGYIAPMQFLAEQKFERWAGGSISAVDAAKDLTFAVIANVVMGFDRQSLLKDDAYAKRLTYLYETVQKAMFAPPINLPGTPFNKALKAREELLAEIEKSIQKIHSGTSAAVGTAPNVASLLLNAVDESGEKITIEQIKDVVFNMLDAGQETTGYTLASIIGSLARHPEILDQLRDEQLGLIEKHGGEKLTSTVLQEMTFAEAVIKEALRNASPEPADRMRGITVIGIKKALKDFQLGGYHIPAGYTIITNSAYVTQHDSRWEDIAESDPMARKKFCPYRWLTEQGMQQSSEFMPFATGPRACIGSALAMAELKVALAVLARKYKWDLVDRAKSNLWKSDPFPYPLDRLPIRFDRIA